MSMEWVGERNITRFDLVFFEKAFTNEYLRKEQCFGGVLGLNITTRLRSRKTSKTQ